jgi:predicted outer membrane repeat protein
MIGGSITNNTVGGAGGGVFVRAGTFTMEGDAEISNNKAGSYSYAGGVCISGGTFMMEDRATISGNTSGGSGGGVCVTGTFTMIGGKIMGNISGGAGGGVYVVGTSTLTMTGGSITENEATGDGGGIWTADYSYANPADVTAYANIDISGTATVANNEAGSTHEPPDNAADFTNRATNSFPGTLLNNDQINYRNPGYKLTVSKTVTGDYADLTKPFEFTLTFTDSANDALNGKVFSYTAAGGGSIKVGGTDVAADGTTPHNLTLNTNGEVTVWLCHGQSITIDGVSTTTKVQIAETTDTRYTATYKVDGGMSQTESTVGPTPMGSADRTVAFTNNRSGVTPTGVSDGSAGTSLLGFVTLAGTLGVSLAARVLRRRRRTGGAPQ